MKKVTMAIAFAAAVIMIAGSMSTHAWDNGPDYKDLYELKQLHFAFHKAVSHAGLNPAEHLKEILALWTDDGTITILGANPPMTAVTYTGKGEQVPAADNGAACADGGEGIGGVLTLCDLYAYHAGSFVAGRDWVSLTPIFTENITLLGDNQAFIYFQCIYFDITTSPPTLKSNVTFGVPGSPNAMPPVPPVPALAQKVNGKWLFANAQAATIVTSTGPPPVFDVPLD